MTHPFVDVPVERLRLTEEGIAWIARQLERPLRDSPLIPRIALAGYGAGWPDAHVTAAIVACNAAGSDFYGSSRRVTCLDCGGTMVPVDDGFECSRCGVNDSGRRGPYNDVRERITAYGDLECLGHESSAAGSDDALNSAIGTVHYCDGSCRR